MVLRKFLTAVLCLSLGACAFKKDDDSKKPVTPETVAQTMEQQKELAAFDGQLTTENVKVSFVEEDPGLYRMVIRWPEQIKKMELLINEHPQNVPLENRSFEAEVTHSTKLSLVLKAYISIDGTSISTLPLDVQAPTDIIVNSRLQLRTDTALEANRIYFYPESQIYTDGYALRIKANKIYLYPSPNQIGDYIDRAQIVTLRSGIVATDSNQISNSPISIEANFAYGLMKVALVGANGKAGRSGTELEKSLGLKFLKEILNGKKGTDGFSKSKPCLKKMGMDLTDCDPTPACIQQPEDGKDGQPGSNGHDGENGLDGSSTGSLAVYVKNQNDFGLEVTRKPGRGGLGGEPAAGHEGGDPGLPGASPAGCRKAVPGQKGAWGQPGKRGQDGHNGNTGEIRTDVKTLKVRDISATELY